MIALSAEELMDWVEKTSSGWKHLLEAHPEALKLPCDIRETQSVAGVIQHIVAVELRFAERLQGAPATDYASIPMDSIAELYQTHDRAMSIFCDLSGNDSAWWEESQRFETRSLGVLKASRRTIFVHALMHSIRHYAQLATLLRHHGVKPEWHMDYLFMGATRV